MLRSLVQYGGHPVHVFLTFITSHKQHSSHKTRICGSVKHCHWARNSLWDSFLKPLH